MQGVCHNAAAMTTAASVVFCPGWVESRHVLPTLFPCILRLRGVEGSHSSCSTGSRGRASGQGEFSQIQVEWRVDGSAASFAYYPEIQAHCDRGNHEAVSIIAVGDARSRGGCHS